MKKLISMTDFVLERSKKSISELTILETFKDGAKITNEIFEYANFLKQPLTLGMFVPCDENSNVLEEPTRSYSGFTHEQDILTKKYWFEVNQYQQAKERVIFDGFLVDRTKKPLTIIRSDTNMNDFLKEILNNAKIEDLVRFNLKITNTELLK